MVYVPPGNGSTKIVPRRLTGARGIVGGNEKQIDKLIALPGHQLPSPNYGGISPLHKNGNPAWNSGPRCGGCRKPVTIRR